MLKNTAYYLILLFLVCLPFDRFYSEVALIFLTVHTVLLADREQWRKLVDSRVLMLQALYLITLLATGYTPYRTQAFADWFRQLPLFLFPWLCAVLTPVLVTHKDRLLDAFSLACVATILYLFGEALRVIHYFGLPADALFSDQFVNHNFSAPLDLHATYLSLYAGLSFLHCIRRVRQQASRMQKMLYGFTALVLLMGLIQLSAKSAWMGLIIMAILAFPLSSFPRRQRVSTLFLAILGCLIVLSVLVDVSSFHRRMVSDLQRDLSLSANQQVGNEARMVRWKVAWSLIRKAPFVGYGTGADQPLLQEAYWKQNLYGPYLHGLNTHNQYLRWWLTAGIPGLCAYLCMLAFGLRTAIRDKDLVWTGFLVLVTIVSLGENILDVQNGLFFFAFFFSFFFFTRRHYGH